MAQRTLVRTQGTLNFNGLSQRQSFNLGKGMLYRELILRWVGTYTATLASNTVANLCRGDEWAGIDQISLVRNGGDLLRSFSGHELAQFNRVLLGAGPRKSPRMGDGVADPTFDSTLILPLWMPMAVKPMDTALDTGNIGTLELQVQTAAGNQILNGGTFVTGVNASLQISSAESFGASGPFSDCRIWPIRQAAPSANNALLINLPTAGIYRGVLINVADASGPTGNDRAADINNIKLVSGGTPFLNLPGNLARDWFRQRLGRDRQFSQTIAAAAAGTAPINGVNLNDFINTRNNSDGWYWVDFCLDGYLGESIDGNGLSDIGIELDVANASANRIITVFPIQVFPNRAVRPAA